MKDTSHSTKGNKMGAIVTKTKDLVFPTFECRKIYFAKNFPGEIDGHYNQSNKTPQNPQRVSHILGLALS